MAPKKGHRKMSQMEKILRDSSRPVFVRIAKGISVPDAAAEVRLTKGNILMLHFTFMRPIVHAKNSQTGRVYRLPLHSEQEYEVLPLDQLLDEKEYDGTRELMETSPFPTSVRVTQAHSSHLMEEVQEEGDVIENLKIETHQKFGKMIVGQVSGSTVHLIRDMNFSKYSTMIYPFFQRLSDVVSRGCPQRVRIPDLSLGENFRKKKEETVLQLNECCGVEYVLATRLGDLRVLVIPVTTPLPLEVISLETVAGRDDTLKAIAALYPLVNPTLNTMDPTHPYLTPAMAGIPQPIDSVLRIWLSKSQFGKQRSRAEMVAYKQETDAQIKDMSAEITRLKSELASRDSTKQRDQGDRPAILEEEHGPLSHSELMTVAPSSAAPIPGDLTDKHRVAVGYASFNKKGSKEQDVTSGLKHNYVDIDDGSDSGSDYEDVVSVVSERELQKAPQEKYNAQELQVLEKRCSQLSLELDKTLEEKAFLQAENEKLLEELEDFQNQQDYTEDYTLLQSPRVSHAETRVHAHDAASGAQKQTTEKKCRPRAKTPPPVPVQPQISKGLESQVCRTLPLSRKTKQQAAQAVQVAHSSTSLISEDKSSLKRGAAPGVKPKPALPKRTSSLPYDNWSARGGVTSPIVPREDEVAPKNPTPSRENPTPSGPDMLIPMNPGSPPAKQTRKPTNEQALVLRTDDHVAMRSSSQPRRKVHKHMSVAEVGLLLEENCLGQYKEKFLKEDINGELLLMLDEQIMIDDLGLSKLHASRLKFAIREYCQI